VRKDRPDMSMVHKRELNIDHIQFFEIGDIGSANSCYILGGKNKGHGPVDSYDAKILEVMRLEKFPPPNKKPTVIPRAAGRRQTPMSIQVELDKCLYVFRIEDAANISFSRTRAPFEIGDGSGDSDPQKIYSDCRLYSINPDGSLEVTIPDAKPLPPGKEYPRATWAGFVFDGKAALDRWKNGEFIYPFNYFIDEGNGDEKLVQNLRDSGGGTGDGGYPGGDQS